MLYLQSQDKEDFLKIYFKQWMYLYKRQERRKVVSSIIWLRISPYRGYSKPEKMY